jgi:putative transposase
LREHEAGAKAGDLARKHGISEATLYNWKAKYGGMDVSDAKRLKALEEENARLKKLLADQMLEASALRALLSKNGRRRSCAAGFATSPTSAGGSAIGGCSSCFNARANRRGSTASIGSTARKGWRCASGGHDGAPSAHGFRSWSRHGRTHAGR